MPFFGVPIRNGLPIGLGSVAGFGVQQFDPSLLFEGGTIPGAWYDPSDLSTMFTTSAGTTPVAMPGQGSAVSVGLMLDKSQNGVGTNGAKRVNLLTYSEQFDNATWIKTALNTTGTPAWINVAVAPNGTTTADKLIPNTSSTSHFTSSGPITGTTNATYTASVYAKDGGYRYAGLSDATTGQAVYDLQTGAVISTDPGITASPAVNVGNGWWRLQISFVASSNRGLGVDVWDNATKTTFAGNGTDGILVWGADLRLASEANTAPTYQRIDANWYSTMAGNHAIAINNTTARPELRARVNLLTYSEEFDNAAWTLQNINPFGSGSTANTAATLDPLGGNTADFITENTASGAHNVYSASTLYPAATYTASVYVKPAGRTWVFLIGISANSFNCYFELTGAGAVGTASSGTTGTIQNVGNGWYRIAVTKTFSSATAVGNTSISLATSDGVFMYTGDGTSGIYIWGADLRPANIGANVPAYQRIADANTYDTNGFPLYLRFDGIDDGMYTPANLNLSATDKVGVFAGVRKLVDSAPRLLTEFSADSFANNGAFGMFAPSGNVPDYYYRSRGTSSKDANGPDTYPAPISNIVTGISDISGDSVILRIDGTQVASNTGDQGTGNYGTYPLNIGVRSATSSPTAYFNGHIHGLIIAGSAVSAGNISATENWVAGKTGIQI